MSTIHTRSRLGARWRSAVRPFLAVSFLLVLVYLARGLKRDGEGEISSMSQTDIPLDDARSDSLFVHQDHHRHNARSRRRATHPSSLLKRTATVPTTLPAKWTYLSCYSDATRMMGTNYTDVSGVSACLTYCQAKGAIWAGLEYGGECFCSTVTPVKSSTAATCTYVCSNGDQCGGYYAMDVYSYGATTSTSTTKTSSIATSTSTKAATTTTAKASSTVAKTTTSSAAAATATWTSFGCYTDAGSPRTLTVEYGTSSAMTPALCEADCLSDGYIYAGLEYGNQCWCGNSIATTAKSSTACAMPCAGSSSLTCGGSYLINVYGYGVKPSASTTATSTTTTVKTTSTTTTSAVPTVTKVWSTVGCYTDGSSRTLPLEYGTSSVLTPALCQSQCLSKGYVVAGTEYGNQCWCGNATATAATKSTACTYACSGDSTQFCGGSYAISIYSYGAAPSSTTTKATSTSAAATSAAAFSQVAVPTTAPPAATASNKAVYVHNIVGNLYGYTLAQWTADIKLAAASGIDGFALNIGADSYSAPQVANAYAAAKALGTTFKMFLSFDMTSLSCTSDADAAVLRNYVTLYANHTNQAHYKGKQLVTTFSGENCYFGESTVSTGWMTHFKTPLATANYSITFMPAIFTDPSTFASTTWMDGELNWNSGWPAGDANLDLSSDTEYMADLGNKSYIAAASPFFFTYYGPNSYNKDFIYRSDNWLLATRFESLISARASIDLIEVISWNDFGESHYIGPILPDSNQPSSGAWVDGFPHEAYLTGLLGYYISAFKTGSWPAVTTDQLYLWSRPHSAAATATSPTAPKPTSWEDTDDNLYAFVFAKAACTVALTAGTNTHTFTVAAGATRLSLASSPGSIAGSIVRSGATVASVNATGLFTWVTTPSDYNFNYYVQAS